jgi:hypothetical protein
VNLDEPYRLSLVVEKLRDFARGFRPGAHQNDHPLGGSVAEVVK